jgi:hypothetical protein
MTQMETGDMLSDGTHKGVKARQTKEYGEDPQRQRGRQDR